MYNHAILLYFLTKTVMKRSIRQFPIGFKIFGLAVTMLLLLFALSLFIYDRSNKVADELVEISDFLIPLEDQITKINNLSIEQAVHLEKVWRLYEIAPLDINQVNNELEIFKNLNVLVKRQIAHANQRIDEVISQLDKREDIIELAQLRAILREIEKEQQDYHFQTFKIIRFIKKDARNRVRFLQKKLETAKVDVEDAIQFLDKAIIDIKNQHSSVDFSPMKTDLTAIKQEHGNVHNHALNILNNLPSDIKVSRKRALLNAKEEEENLEKEEIEVQKTLQSSNATIMHVENQHNSITFTPLKSSLGNVDKESQGLYNQSLNIIQLLYEDSKVEAELLQEELQKEQDELNKKMETTMSNLAALTNKAAHFIEIQTGKILLFSKSLVGFATFIGLLFSSIVTFGLTRPVKNLLNGTSEIEKGNLDVDVAVKSRDEIGDLTGMFNKMVQDIREKEHIKATFGQYVDPRIVDDLIKKSGLVQNRGEKKVVTLFFSDVVAFSGISERLTPNGLVNLINQYLTLVSEPIARYSGVIDKFIGDAVMAFWGPPFVNENQHAKLACNAALEQFVQLDKLRKRLPDLMGLRKGLPLVNIRIGLATGEVLVGNIGSDNSKSYTVIGNATKIAKALEELNKTYGTQILVMDKTRDLSSSFFETRKIDLIHAHGNKHPIYIYELLGHTGELDAETEEMRDTFEAGLQLYWKLSSAKAKQHFENCLKIKKDDGPSKLFLKRIDMLQESPPKDTWDGVWV